MTWHVYVVRAADGRLYTGIATDVARRLDEHDGSGGRGAKSLRGRGPLELAYSREIGDRALALRVEHRLKRLRRPAKLRLIAEAPDRPGLLARLEVEPA